MRPWLLFSKQTQCLTNGLTDVSIYVPV